MAEILLSLTIIGVVAAITLPSLTGNINERTWNTQRKALYARMSQAIALMPSLNGYGTLSEDESGSVTTDTATETFITAGLSKVLKTNNICDSEHLADCGIPDKFTNLAASVIDPFPKTLLELNDLFVSAHGYNTPDTKAAAFETANGESIVAYYNPYCSANNTETDSHQSQPKMCVNFIYDLNGSKGPNTVGKDIGFMTVLYASDSVVAAPIPLMQDAQSAPQVTAGGKCTALDTESRLPNYEEAAAMFVNKTLIGGTLFDGRGYWTSAVISSEYGWRIYYDGGNFYKGERVTHENSVRCIKR
ncbi:MAG: type II secretion system GspH family protein [Fusobacterium sp.]|nr:type II secretion system GspH family protein [Fusobacterium sp.]